MTFYKYMYVCMYSLTPYLSPYLNLVTGHFDIEDIFKKNVKFPYDYTKIIYSYSVNIYTLATRCNREYKSFVHLAVACIN